MSKPLVESIIDKDFVLAESLFRDRLEIIKEQKLFELKKIVQAEAAFPSGAAGVAARKAAGFRRASDVLGDPTADKKPKVSAAKPKAQTPADEWKGMSFGQKKKVVKGVRAAVAKHLAAAEPEKKPETVSQATSSKAPEVKIAPDEIKKAPSVAKPLKKDKSLRTVDRYKKNLERISALKSRGYSPEHAQKKAEYIKKAYRGTRAKEIAKNVAGRLGQGVKAAVTGLSGYGSLAE